ncbi:6-carboxytetrahydropterin synthase [Saprospiraceae bacterium]|nr:6-carboxytetrahydropterin synthase [Saprospiraceae bacterium]
MKIAVFRKAHFNAAHRLHVEGWSDERNKEVFGLCNNPHFHGHNYEMEVKVVGEVDPDTGYMIDMKYLKDIIRDKVEDKLDHKNLNLEVEEFQNTNPTCENICYLIWKIISAELGEKYDVTIRLYETPRNFCEYPA